MRIALLETLNRDGWSRDQARFGPVARLLAGQGHEILLVGAGSGDGDGGVPHVTHLTFERGPVPVLTALNRDVGAGPMIESNLAAHHLAGLDLDLVIAGLRGGLAQGVLMARACGEAFKSTRVALWCDTPSHLHFLHADDLDTGIAPLVADAIERQSLALADALILPDEREVESLTKLGGRTLPYFVADLPTLPTAVTSPSHAPAAAIDEIVFVGPLRRSAGVDEFVHAIERLAKAGLLTGRTVTFLGPSRPYSAAVGKTWLGLRAANWSFRFRVIDQSSQSIARQYISKPGRIGVGIADEIDDLGFLRGDGRHIALLRNESDQENLTGRIEAALRTSLENRQLIDPPNAAAASDWPAIARAIQAIPRPAAPLPSTSSGVTVCILHHNRLGKLAELLETIPRAINGSPVEVVVVDNASGIPEVKKEILAIAGDRPLIRIIELIEPLPPAAAHNRALAEARFETVLFSDDDNIFMPGGVQSLTRAIAVSEFDIVVSALDVFDEGSPHSMAGRLIFLGAAHSAGLFFNAFGDTAMAVRRDKFLGLGGFHDPGYLYPCRDWVTLAKAQAAGHRLGALQWPAVRYRRDTVRSDLGAHKLDQEGARSIVFDVYGDAYDARVVVRYAQKLYLGEA